MFSVRKFITRFCEPDPCEYSNPWERQLVYDKHLGQTINHITNILFTFLAIPFIQGVPLHIHIIHASAILVLLIVSKYLWKYSRFHNFLFALIISVYSPLVVFIDKRAIFHAIAGLIGNMNCTHVATGSFLCVLAVGLSHAYSMCTFYSDAFSGALQATSPEVLYQNMIFTVLAKIAGAAGIALSREYTFQNTFKILHESKKAEIEQLKTFFHSFSHEFRNPVNSMIGNISLAVSEEIPHHVKDMLNKALVCGELLTNLISNVLDQAKADIGELAVFPTQVKIYEQVTKIWGLCSAMIKGKNLKGILKVDRSLPLLLKLDPYRTLQIILNLVGNACKFTQQGQITMTFKWIPGPKKVDDEHFLPEPFD